MLFVQKHYNCSGSECIGVGPNVLYVFHSAFYCLIVTRTPYEGGKGAGIRFVA